ncbi:mannose-6-phosphate isomerase, class I [Kosakonia sacchari]|uniref:mannose-6-phosphate isomerase, class I n=1 Tax=Kosakonia sacchari TaxID=1158459 RepID=UPI002ACDE7A8|nr:mannose-6-phosphate isomerase, class I [Kosakonia sacchari]MDZ7320064.1 mannose-6-phosphate isomerase, class I [Kosakonia sacchari]
MSHCFYPLVHVVKNYPWGSRSALNARFHIPNPDDQPQAELWMGVHPAGISQVICEEGSCSLAELIAGDKTAMLGSRVAGQFGDLPYLLKILAAERALSIQVHPQKAQAQAGFHRQQNNPPDYNDDNHKPELVYAITPFMAMNGFRQPTEIVRHFKKLNIASLEATLNSLALYPCAETMQAFFVTLMQLPQDEKQKALTRLLDEVEALYDPTLASFIFRLRQHYPDDIGLFAPLFLNCLTLQPGEAMFLSPGTLHAYVQGVAVEVMASSDNVLRAGLTDKNINLAELVACTVFEPICEEQLRMTPAKHSGWQHYDIPVEDFCFDAYSHANNLAIQTSSAEIVLVIDGQAALYHASGEVLTLDAGRAAFIPASTRDWTLSVSGTLCRVYV